MKALQEMSIGHIIIEAVALFIAIVAAFYLIYSVIYLIVWINNGRRTPDEEQCELHSRVRYKVTEDLMNEINNNQNSIK